MESEPVSLDATTEDCVKSLMDGLLTFLILLVA